MQKKIKSFDKCKINYDICREKGKNNFLIFIHGTGVNLTVWKMIRLFFHKLGIPTIAIDLRGHGKSGRPKFLEEYSLTNFAKDVKEVITKEKISNPTLIGHSLGGMVALTFHKLYPNLSKKYVIISSSYKTPKKLKFVIKKFSSLINFLNKKLELINPPQMISYGRSNPFFNNSDDFNLGVIFQNIVKTSFKSWLFTLENINRFDEEIILKTIKKPVLILSGGKDNVVNVGNSKRLHHFIKGSKLKIFSKRNHGIIFSNPKEISKEIYSFIGKK